MPNTMFSSSVHIKVLILFCSFKSIQVNVHSVRKEPTLVTLRWMSCSRNLSLDNFILIVQLINSTM